MCRPVRGGVACGGGQGRCWIGGAVGGGAARPRMLRSIVTMAHDNDMDVIAEGAESESDVIELFQIGYIYGQGNIFGQSITPLEARKLMGASTDVAA